MKQWVMILSGLMFSSFGWGGTFIMVNGQTVNSSSHQVSVSGGTVKVNGQVVSRQNALEVVLGSGKFASERRKLAGFSGVSLTIPASVVVSRGKKSRLTITADDNILPLIATEVEGRVLNISAGQNYTTRHNLSIAIETPRLESVTIQGSGTIFLDEVQVNSLALAISGSGRIEATGRVGRLIATVNGSGDVVADALEVSRAEVTLNGSGSATIYPQEALTARVLGSGEIYYRGSITNVEAAVLGSGNIARVQR